MSFGKWYEEKKAEESSGDGSAGSPSSSWFDTETLPLYSSEAMQNLSWSNMKASMEAQMPRQIMGMGYQQRFKVREKREL
jgi:hypothetical protein